MRLPGAAFAYLAFAVTHASADTQDVASFYAGKTITVSVAGGAGGGYDAYARPLVQYLPKYMPGHPSVTIQNVPGGGGMVAANNIYNIANRDGTALALLQSSTLLVGALGEKNAKFDNMNFTFVANFNQEVDTCSVWHTTGINNADTFLHRDVILGTAGPGSNSQTFPMAMIDALGAKFKLIPGFEGASRLLAMERGEIEGTCGLFVSTLRSQFETPIREGKMRVVLQMGLERHPTLKDIPNALELARDEESRQALKVLFSQLALGRPIVGPPGIPPDRAAALSKAIEQMIDDPKYQQEAAQINLETRWFGPDQMRRVMTEMNSASDLAKARLRTELNVK